jgi:hypothetical protein
MHECNNISSYQELISKGSIYILGKFTDYITWQQCLKGHELNSYSRMQMTIKIVQKASNSSGTPLFCRNQW